MPTLNINLISNDYHLLNFFIGRFSWKNWFLPLCPKFWNFFLLVLLLFSISSSKLMSFPPNFFFLSYNTFGSVDSPPVPTFPNFSFRFYMASLSSLERNTPLVPNLSFLFSMSSLVYGSLPPNFSILLLRVFSASSTLTLDSIIWNFNFLISMTSAADRFSLSSSFIVFFSFSCTSSFTYGFFSGYFFPFSFLDSAFSLGGYFGGSWTGFSSFLSSLGGSGTFFSSLGCYSGTFDFTASFFFLGAISLLNIINESKRFTNQLPYY